MDDVQGSIALYYEDVDITDEVDIIECTHRDVSGGESDCLNLLVDHAETWFRWGPQKNDRIRVTRSGYDTKTLFLNTVVPENGAYRIYATAARSEALPRRWQAFEGKTLDAVMSACAGECGMGAKQYGISGEIRYEYLLRENLSAPAFLEMLLNWEGAQLKALDGSYVAIGVEWAQELPVLHEMELDSEQADCEYIDRRDQSWAHVRIETPFGHAIARDSGAGGTGVVLTGLPVDSDAMACRWAKGLLLMHNRLSETLNIEMDFNPGYTAMVRVDVKSSTDAAGQWMVDAVEQNLLDGRTKAKLHRCVRSIG